METTTAQEIERLCNLSKERELTPLGTGFGDQDCSE